MSKAEQEINLPAAASRTQIRSARIKQVKKLIGQHPILRGRLDQDWVQMIADHFDHLDETEITRRFNDLAGVLQGKEASVPWNFYPEISFLNDSDESVAIQIFDSHKAEVRVEYLLLTRPETSKALSDLHVTRFVWKMIYGYRAALKDVAEQIVESGFQASQKPTLTTNWINIPDVFGSALNILKFKGISAGVFQDFKEYNQFCEQGKIHKLILENSAGIHNEEIRTARKRLFALQALNNLFASRLNGENKTVDQIYTDLINQALDQDLEILQMMNDRVDAYVLGDFELPDLEFDFSCLKPDITRLLEVSEQTSDQFEKYNKAVLENAAKQQEKISAYRIKA